MLATSREPRKATNRTLTAWSAVLTGAALVPFKTGVPIENRTPGNPSVSLNVILQKCPIVGSNSVRSDTCATPLGCMEATEDRRGP
ncbi:hypothetical protein UY3_15102 [Chelonia mydas]|uniref:Uncharacterized protein n=1 Tax=Chelonia mydas TaxID=8469 RepID=M7AR55_CHEMY|nr:hypothetical protein UY3_15102 [Chelonia mydas]